MGSDRGRQWIAFLVMRGVATALVGAGDWQDREAGSHRGSSGKAADRKTNDDETKWTADSRINLDFSKELVSSREWQSTAARFVARALGAEPEG